MTLCTHSPLLPLHDGLLVLFYGQSNNLLVLPVPLVLPPLACCFSMISLWKHVSSSVHSENCWRSSSCYDWKTVRIFKREPIADIPPLCQVPSHPLIPTKIEHLYWGVSCATDISPYRNMLIWGVVHLPSSHPRVGASVVPLWTWAATSCPITFDLLFHLFSLSSGHKMFVYCPCQCCF